MEDNQIQCPKQPQIIEIPPNNCGDETLFDWAREHQNINTSKETLKEVANIYRKLCKNDFPMAYNNLGFMYYCGLYFDKDIDKAIELYEKAVEYGVAIAFANLGCCYYYEKKNYKKAYEMFSEGAFLFREPECLYMLGDMYKLGLGVEQHDCKSFELYMRAFEACDDNNTRDHECLGDIHARIGESILYGIGTKQDTLQALKALNMSLGILYERISEDQFVMYTIDKVKKLVEEAEEELELDRVSIN